FLEGRIQSREYQDRDQNKRTSYEIVCTSFRMLGGRGDGAAGGGAGASGGDQPEAPAAAPAEEFGHGPDVSDEDIPF
ncbi:MAG TPA: hypothetical protein VKG84_01645, partial [Candidatus Acidoferrales bacterium]|nr:hypothetical protein [Candidatus Acidoferrales bacterium]